jgi:hypothetical protein
VVGLQPRQGMCSISHRPGQPYPSWGWSCLVIPYLY